MSQDYCYQKIKEWKEIAGVMVPVAEWGHYLDWQDIRGDEARDLTSPYGALHFAVGYGDEWSENYSEVGDWFRCFDYADLPDERIVLHAVDNTESGGYIETAHYEIVERDQAPRDAMGMVDEALMIIGDHGQDHDEAGWNQDPYYFVRAILRHVGVKPYADVPLSLSDDQLRRGDIPDV
jgi:hypothetical protein